jgi:hypothetical protein
MHAPKDSRAGDAVSMYRPYAVMYRCRDPVLVAEAACCKLLPMLHCSMHAAHGGWPGRQTHLLPLKAKAVFDSQATHHGQLAWSEPYSTRLVAVQHTRLAVRPWAGMPPQVPCLDGASAGAP